MIDGIPKSLLPWFDVYFAACRGMRDGIDRLRDELRPHEGAMEEVLEGFSQSLRSRVFGLSDTGDLGKIAGQCQIELNTLADYVDRKYTFIAGGVLRGIAHGVAGSVGTGYMPGGIAVREFRRAHDRGREFARAFYARTDRDAIVQRLHLAASPKVTAVPARDVWPADWCQPVLPAMRLTGSASRRGLIIEVNAPDVCGADYYFNLPLMFMHEYVSHIFADDGGMGDIFYDGWLFFAAAAYLCGADVCPEEELAFDTHWAPRLVGPARKGCQLARVLYISRDPAVARGLKSMTHELAAKSSKSFGRDSWHEEILQGLDADHAAAVQLLRGFRDTRTLMKSLTVAKAKS
jgi:hypothetical protein